VQKSLLPDRLEKDNDFEVAAFSQSADEVGGDYYDTIRIDDHQVALIIADVPERVRRLHSICRR
jgi:sigma-B regulation protein RsbU (phosphoserine phosphatase)